MNEVTAEEFLVEMNDVKDSPEHTVIYDMRDDRLKIIFLEENVTCVSPVIGRMLIDDMGKFVEAIENLSGDDYWLTGARNVRRT